MRPSPFDDDLQAECDAAEARHQADQKLKRGITAWAYSNPEAARALLEGKAVVLPADELSAWNRQDWIDQVRLDRGKP